MIIFAQMGVAVYDEARRRVLEPLNLYGLRGDSLLNPLGAQQRFLHNRFDAAASGCVQYAVRLNEFRNLTKRVNTPSVTAHLKRPTEST